MLRSLPYARAYKHNKLESLREEMKASPSQLYKEVEALKHALTGENLSETELWKTRQELCHLLESLLLIDLDYALDQKVEQDLWSFVFRNPIAACQSKAKEQKNVNNVYSKSQLSTLLDTASGFYLQLLQKLCCAYDIDLPCHPRDSVYGLTKEWISRYPVAEQPRKSSLFYICQHCLVHLGDIARYRGQSLQAENFYRHAVDLVPSNGQPYNQLALLEAASGEKLSTVFFYMRSLSVQHPFPLAANNLRILFSKMSSDGLSNDGKMRMTAFEYITSFLHFQAAVHLYSDLDKAQSIVGQLTSSLPALIIAEKFETWQLVQMVAVCLFAIAHTWGSVDLEKCFHSNQLMTADELKATLLLEELLGGLLYAFLFPIHASPEPKETAMYYTLPAVKIILDWFLQDPKLRLHEPISRKHQIWHALCKLLNDLDVVSSEPFDAKKFEDIPLPEDWDLQCFLPLKQSQRGLKFNLSAETPSDEESVWLRSVRLCKLGEHLSDAGKQCLSLLAISYVSGRRHFKANHYIGSTAENVIHQIQELNVSPTTSKQLTDMSLHTTNANINALELLPTSVRVKTNCLEVPLQQEVRFKLDDIQVRKDKFEHDREDKLDRRVKDCQSSFGGGRRMVKNVAMQAILQQQANLNLSSPNILGRNPDFRKDTLIQPDLMVRQTRPPSRLDSTLHIRANQETRAAQSVQEQLNLNRSKLHHIQNEPYNSVQCSPKQSLDLNAPSERDSWMQSYKMHQGGISNSSQIVHNSMDSLNSYLQSPMSHIIQPPSDFSYHQNQVTPQPSHIVNKSAAAPFLSNPSPNMMWNYMNFMTSYPQAYSGGRLTPPHTPMVMQQGNDHLQSNGQLQQQNGYFVMNNGTRSKMPSVESSAPSNLLHSYRNNGVNGDYQSVNGDSLISHNTDIFHDKVPEQSASHSVPNVWKSDTSLHNGMESNRFNQFPLNQVVSRAVGQTVQNHPSQDHDCGNSSSNASRNHDSETNTYSLFNSPWPSGLSVPRISKESQNHNTTDSAAQSRVQSLWSGPGPSALERLLEQQKQRRDTTAL